MVPEGDRVRQTRNGDSMGIFSNSPTETEAGSHLPPIGFIIEIIA
jgi:hypothetical protein